MALYFKDRIPDPIHGENMRYYDAVGDSGTVKLSDFKLVLKNNIPAGKFGDPLSAGNLNFASGNISLPAPADFETKKGHVLTLTPDGAVPAKTQRNITALGVDYPTAVIDGGFIKLSDNKLLIIYNNRMVVATVDFANKTVVFGQYFNAPSESYRSVLTLVRSYDENPTALVCVMFYNSYGTQYFPVIYQITGDVISNLPAGYIYPSTQNKVTNPVRVSNTSILACSADSNNNNCYASLINCAGATPVLTTQVIIPGITGATTLHTLRSYDKGGGKCLLIYQQGSNIYAVTLIVSGSSVSCGSPQLLGTTADTLTGTGFYHGGTDCYSGSGDKIILTGNNGFSPYGPGKIQILSLDSSGIITKGTIINLPIYDFYPGTTLITYLYKNQNQNQNEKIYLTGVDFEVNPKDACMLEFEINGANMQGLKKYRAFIPVKSSNSSAYALIKCGAYENPDKSGEFLFIESNSGAPLQNLTFWFGFKSDCAEPNNIIGIALDDAENGWVIVQTSGKNLPGIFNNLQAGLPYTAGLSGGLTQYTGAAGTKILGIATGEKDLQFFGAATV